MSADATGPDGLVAPAVIPADAVSLLDTSRVTLVGRMPNASNATFLVRLDDPDDTDDLPAQPRGLAIYKPERGERPLWDFPHGLYRREVAAYRLGVAAGLDALAVVPPTVARLDGLPLGPGSVQWFVNADFREHYFSLHEERPDLHDRFRRIAGFDLLVNNTDRKSGHCLYEPASGEVWGIDNGLCFSMHARLRTVIWDFSGEPLPDDVLTAAARLAEEVPDDVAELLDPTEVEGLAQRAADLVDSGEFPFDETGYGHPWPLI